MKNSEYPIEQWANAAETDCIVAIAIMQVSTDVRTREDIWRDPTSEEVQKVREYVINDIATDNGLAGEFFDRLENGVVEYCWGKTETLSISRGDVLEEAGRSATKIVLEHIKYLNNEV